MSDSEYETKYAFGVEPLQQYLIEFPGIQAVTTKIARHTALNRFMIEFEDRLADHV